MAHIGSGSRSPIMPGSKLSRGGQGPSGILVGDGDYFWTYWPEGKPRYGFEFNGKYAEEYEKERAQFHEEARPVGGTRWAIDGQAVVRDNHNPSTFMDTRIRSSPIVMV